MVVVSKEHIFIAASINEHNALFWQGEDDCSQCVMPGEPASDGAMGCILFNGATLLGILKNIGGDMWLLSIQLI